MVATCAYRSLGSHIYTIMNDWLGREKDVLETESNSLNERSSGNTSPMNALKCRTLGVHACANL